MHKYKVLNLYAGIGGNRKLWGDDVEVVAVEFDEKIAAIYKGFFPNDIVVVGDAHDYLLKHYKKFDFIWSSPPCPTHSRVNSFLNAQGIIRYPDMSLYQEVIFLKHFYKGKYCVENVKSYYDPLIKPQESGRHYFWANFEIPQLKVKTNVKSMFGKNNIRNNKLDGDEFFVIPGLKFHDDSKNLYRKVLNNCCHPEIGLEILNSARGLYHDKYAMW